MSGDDESPDISKALLGLSTDAAKANLTQNTLGNYGLSLFSDKTHKHLQDNLIAANDLSKLFAKKTADASDKLRKMAESVFPPTGSAFFNKDSLTSMPETFHPNLDEITLRIPKNPIHETNDKLEILLDHTEQTNQLLHEYVGKSTTLLSTLNSSILSMAADAAKDGQITHRQNKWVLGLAAISLLVTAIFSFWTYLEESSDIKLRALNTSFNKSTEANTKILEEIERTNGIRQQALELKIFEIESKVNAQKQTNPKPAPKPKNQ